MATLLPEIYRALCQSPEFLGQFEVRVRKMINCRSLTFFSFYELAKRRELRVTELRKMGETSRS